MRINVDSDSFLDPRFAILGQKLGISEHEAFGRCIRVWNENYRGATYYLTARRISGAALLAGFAEAMVFSELARKEDDGTYYICGTRGRIEWVMAFKERAKKAAEARWNATSMLQASLKHAPSMLAGIPPSPSLAPAPTLEKTTLPIPDGIGGLVEEVSKNGKGPSDASLWASGFDSYFWKLYPRKVGKASAVKAWNAHRPKKRDDFRVRGIAIHNLLSERLDGEWRDRPPDKIPYPATFLRGESFDEP